MFCKRELAALVLASSQLLVHRWIKVTWRNQVLKGSLSISESMVWFLTAVLLTQARKASFFFNRAMRTCLISDTADGKCFCAVQSLLGEGDRGSHRTFSVIARCGFKMCIYAPLTLIFSVLRVSLTLWWYLQLDLICIQNTCLKRGSWLSLVLLFGWCVFPPELQLSEQHRNSALCCFTCH